jgi:uncharacterized protein DUF2490
MRRLPLLTAPLLLVAAPAAAGPRDDFQVWTILNASGTIEGRWLAQGDANIRFGGEGTRLYQRTIRGALGYKLGKKASIYAGYANVLNYVDGGPNRSEHRLFQQLSLDLGRAGGGSLTGRTRLEERFMEGGDDIGLRLRQQLRYARPLDGDLSIFVSAEGFVALNDTDWGARAGFERLRSAAGLRHPVAARVSGELGYLNQYTRRRNGRDTMDHAMTVALSLSF